MSNEAMLTGELQGRPPLPTGEYQVIVEDQGFKGFSRNKNDTGDNLQITFKVVGGDFDGRLIFMNYCVEHTSATAQEISRRQINNYLEAVGSNTTYEDLPHREGLRDFINMPLLADIVAEKEGRNGYYPANKIKEFRAL